MIREELRLRLGEIGAAFVSLIDDEDVAANVAAVYANECIKSFNDVLKPDDVQFILYQVFE